MSYNQCHIAYRFYNEQWLFQGDDGCSYLCTVVWYVIDLQWCLMASEEEQWLDCLQIHTHMRIQ